MKLPFPLTQGFKPMLQRGIETPDLDVRWVSSISWYFLNLFGLNGLFKLILGNDNGPSRLPFAPTSYLHSVVHSRRFHRRPCLLSIRRAG